jgi:hypothetical protein
MTAALEKLEHLKGLEAEKAQLLKDLEVSLKFQALPQEVFKYGSCTTQWQIYRYGNKYGRVEGWTKQATIYEWNDRRAKIRARIDRGGVDFVYVDESEMPIKRASET